MRNRTELVTTTMAESDNDSENNELDDSEEDWKPAEKKKGRGSTATTPAKKTPAGKRKSPATAKAGKGSASKAKKMKKEESEPDSDEEELEEEEEEEDDDDDDDDEEETTAAADGKDSNNKRKEISGKQSRNKANNKSFPDKDGKFELFLFKNDLSKDFRNDAKLCMWRRDGSSLLQKYIKTKDEDGTANSDDVIFAASSVYSCWEEKRKNDFFQIKVQCIGEKKDGKVKVLDVPELDKYAAEERPKIETTLTNDSTNNNVADDEGEGDGDDDEEDEDDEEDGEENENDELEEEE